MKKKFFEDGFKKNIIFGLEPISKLRLRFLARRETARTWSIHVVCEHFEPIHNSPIYDRIDEVWPYTANTARGT